MDIKKLNESSNRSIVQKVTKQQLVQINQLRKLSGTNVIGYDIILNYTLNHPYFHDVILGINMDPGLIRRDFNRIIVRITSYIKMDKTKRCQELKKMRYNRKLVKEQIEEKYNDCIQITPFSKRCVIEGQLRQLDNIYYCYHRTVTILEVMIKKG